MSDTNAAALPKEIESLVALAKSESASIRTILGMVYWLGRIDGMLDYAKADIKQIAPAIEEAALEGAA